MFQNLFNYPKINWKAIPRILKGMTTDIGDYENWTWYDRQGNETALDPYKQNEVFDAFGKRHVFYRGNWVMDDPTAGQSFNHPLVGAGLVYTGWASFPVPFGTAVGRSFGLGGTPIETNPSYSYMDGRGNYVGSNGQVIEPGTYQWLRERWGDEIPESVLEDYGYGNPLEVGLDGTPEGYDALPEEGQALQELEWERSQWYMNNQGLVKIGRPPTYGDTFVINGQKAIMGRPDGTGHIQYAVTQPGEGDRWKYKTIKDKDGNWMRMYYRTYGAVKEKRDRLKAKGKE